VVERAFTSAHKLRKKIYLPEALFDAFSGFIRTVCIMISGLACVAKLQIPLRHFAAGFA
jgi:hypothetical protein